MLMERKWAMSNKWTFRIRPIQELLAQEINGEFVDPFAGKFSPCKITNDLNPDIPATYHMDAFDFLKQFPNDSVDGVLYDPPYSPRQVKECYDGIRGKVICFGWNSMGIGINRGFVMTRILLVAHGGAKNDTICTVEIKERSICR